MVNDKTQYNRVLRIITIHVAKLYRHNMSIISPHELDDIKQFCFLRLIRSGRYEEKNLSIIGRIVKCACIDYMRRNFDGYRSRKYIRPIYIDENIYFANSLEDNNKYRSIDYLNDIISIYQLSICLSSFVEHTILKHYIFGFNDVEIGEKLNISSSRVSQIRKIILKTFLRYKKEKA